MIKYNENPVNIGHFPDGTLLMKELATGNEATITWLYENNEELLAVYFLTKHLQAKGVKDISLKLPYIPNARQDRVKKDEDVFTLKYFSQIINSLGFKKVTVLDPHSYVSEALIDNVVIESPKQFVFRAIEKIEAIKKISETNKTAENKDDILMFYPDEGAMKRYSGMFDLPYTFGIKKRDWTTGDILGLEVSGQKELVKGSTILIVDDICSKGGTFYHSAKALKELGADKIYLYISHCENTIIEGEIIKSDLIEKVYTTNSIFTKNNEKIEVFDYE